MKPLHLVLPLAVSVLGCASVKPTEARRDVAEIVELRVQKRDQAFELAALVVAGEGLGRDLSRCEMACRSVDRLALDRCH